MDERRLDTAGFIAMGGLNLPAPQTDIPGDRERVEYGDVRENVAAALDAGKVIEAFNDYGIPCAWRERPGMYRGQLIQYRRVTEDETFATVDEAVEWITDRAARTDG